MRIEGITEVADKRPAHQAALYFLLCYVSQILPHQCRIGPSSHCSSVGLSLPGSRMGSVYLIGLFGGSERRKSPNREAHTPAGCDIFCRTRAVLLGGCGTQREPQAASTQQCCAQEAFRDRTVSHVQVRELCTDKEE